MRPAGVAFEDALPVRDFSHTGVSGIFWDVVAGDHGAGMSGSIRGWNAILSEQ
jgi:hypothetical protein